LCKVKFLKFVFIVVAIAISVTQISFACDEYIDSKTGFISRSGSPEDCEYFLNEAGLDVDLFKSMLKSEGFYENEDEVLVQGVFFSPVLCPICPLGSMCKPCIPSHYVLKNSETGSRVRLMVDNLIKKVYENLLKKNGSHVILNIKINENRQVFEVINIHQ
jgi:hypothetical protein